MSKKILIVDDSALMRRVMCDIINSDGTFQVTDTCRDGLEAYEKLKTTRYDGVVLDVNMPRMDGFSFIIAVREQDAYKDIPIIILSTEGGEEDIQKGIRLGANLYMVKPAQPEKMVRNIKMLLG